MTMLDALVARRTDARPLAIARIGIGVAALLKVIAAAPVLDAVLAPGALRAPYVAWLPALPSATLPTLVVVWTVAAGALALGWRTRWAASILVAILTYVLALDQQIYSSHLYLLIPNPYGSAA